MRKRLLILGLAIAMATAAAAVSLAAAAEPTQRLYIGMSLHFTGPDTTAGTFVVSGAVADSGAADVRDLTITPGNADSGRLSGTETYNGQQGTIVTHFQGVAFPLSSPHEVGIGQFEIVSGTGAYTGLTGHGTFQIVVDTTPPTSLIGTETATVQQ